MNKEIVLFSGRFDAPHCGHIKTIQELGGIFFKVIVVVLDYEKARYPVDYRMEVLAKILGRSYGMYEIIANDENFECIKIESAKKFTFDIYASGNTKCVAHMKALGFRTLNTPRSWHYEASKEI